MIKNLLLFLFTGFLSVSVNAQKSLDLGKQKQLVYECNFENKSSLEDWVMEGPGISKINKGRLELCSKYHKKVYRKMKKGKIVFEEGSSRWYQNYVDGLAKKAEPELYPTYKKGDTFRGGHLVYWNKTITPKNYVIEFDFQSPIPYPLHMIMFSGTGTKGESVFDPSLKPRCGVAAQYTKGDIYNYRISFLAPKRGTANLRKCPGRRLVTKGKDYTLNNLTGKHHIKVIKWNDQIEFHIDGQRVFHYNDTENDKPLGAGHTAIRLMVPARGYYDNYQIFELSE
ncbi:MAG: DUF1961 family protein [Marinifilaceae bacterium]